MNYLQLIQALQTRNYIPAADLAEILGVSERSIRNYVRDANASLDGSAEIVMRRGRGYELVVIDHASFEIKMQQARDMSEASIPSTSKGRVRFLANELVSSGSWVTLEELATKLYSSRRTVSQNLKDVEEFIAPYGLTLERRSHRGVRISGAESGRRIALAALALEGEGQDDGKDLLDIRSLKDSIQGEVTEILQQEDYKISSYSYQNLLIHIAVMVTRVRSGCTVPMTADELENVLRTSEYRIASCIGEAIEDQYGVALPTEEVAYIAIHLAGRQSVSSAPDESGMVISDEVWQLVNQMLAAVKDSMGYDFSTDIELRMNLAKHVTPLVVRLRHHLSVQNPLLSDIRSRFPLAYAMAMDASSVLTMHCGQPLSDEEIGFIALDFALALERRRTTYPRKNILIVCASGAGSARLLQQQYRQEFGSFLGIVKACDLSGLDAVDFTDIDYVFTTVPLGRQLPVPVREVTYFPDAQEIQSMKEELSLSTGSDSIQSYFDKSLFFPHLSFKDKEETIDFLCTKTMEQVELPPDFEQLVMKRERLAQTSFGNRVAMPHPQIAVAPYTVVSIGILDEPVPWNSHRVQVVFLVCISSKRDKDLQPFYRSMARTLTSKSAIDELIAHQDYQTLMALLSDSQQPKE